VVSAEQSDRDLVRPDGLTMPEPTDRPGQRLGWPEVVLPPERPDRPAPEPWPAPLLSRAEIVATAGALAAMQEPDGAIPWSVGAHTEAWDHLECVMALELGGYQDAAERGWEWLVRNQRPDGSWAGSTVDGVVKEAHADSNQCAYVATAVWHRWRRTGDRAFVERMWPVVRAGLDFVVDLQAPSGQIWWARSADGDVHPSSLVTGCSSTLHSLRCGLGLAELVGEAQHGWELATGALAHAVRTHPEYFLPTDRWSMDWYYPVIGGVLKGAEGLARLRARWDEFVVDGMGIRCVADQPWVTGAETCELAIAMHLVGETEAARKLVDDMQHLRHDDGAYWTGWQFESGCHWPVEHSSYTAAAVILAVDVLAGGVSEAVFRGDDLPEPMTILELERAEDTPSPAQVALPVPRVPPAPRGQEQLELACDCEPAPLLAAWASGPLADRLTSALG